MMVMMMIGILETDSIKQTQMKEKIKEYCGRTRKQPENKLSCRNFIKGSNTYCLSYKIHLTILKMDKGGTMTNQRTRKLMTIHKALHCRYYKHINM